MRANHRRRFDCTHHQRFGGAHRLLSGSAVAVVVAAALSLGCAGHLTVSREVQVKMSQSIFLEPVEDRRIYVEHRNTSGNPHVSLDGLSARLQAKGYTVVAKPAEAKRIVQANTLYCDKSKPGTTLDTLLAGGFGAAVGSAVGTASALSGGSLSHIPVFGAVGGLVGAGLSKATEDTVYVCAVDVQITERTSEAVTQQLQQHTGPATGPSIALNFLGGLTQSRLAPPAVPESTKTTTETRTGHQRVHQTRVVASAQQMWLSIEEASKEMANRLSEVVAGVL